MKTLFRIEAPQRRHPVIAALFWTYCPQAFAWWQSGVDMSEETWTVYDQALGDYAAGKTLGDRLREWGFTPILDEVRAYIEAVDLFRANHRTIQGPEKSLFFREVFKQLPPHKANPLYHQMCQSVRSWDNFYEYIWTFAFGIPDWTRGLALAREEPTIDQVGLPVKVGRSETFEVPVWRFHDGINYYVCVLEGDPAFLLTVATLFGDFDAVSAIPAIHILHLDGAVRRFNPPMDIRMCQHTLTSLSVHLNAYRGAWPGGALEIDDKKCRGCAYNFLCWETPNTLRDLLPAKEKQAG